MTDYRTPSLDEFIPGFEYEINLESTQWVQFNDNMEVEELTPVYEHWQESRVPEFTSGIDKTEYPDGQVIMWVKNPEMDKKYYFQQIEGCLQNNQIRVKQ